MDQSWSNLGREKNERKRERKKNRKRKRKLGEFVNERVDIAWISIVGGPGQLAVSVTGNEQQSNGKAESFQR